MNTIPKIKRKLIKRLMAMFSFTTALFIFQACYGVPQDFMDDSIYLSGTVRSETTNEPIEGIKISYSDDSLTSTNINGEITAFIFRNDTIRLSFEDSDITKFGAFESKDTFFTPTWEEDSIYFEILLPEVQD